LVLLVLAVVVTQWVIWVEIHRFLTGLLIQILPLANLVVAVVVTHGLETLVMLVQIHTQVLNQELTAVVVEGLVTQAVDQRLVVVLVLVLVVLVIIRVLQVELHRAMAQVEAVAVEPLLVEQHLQA
jgi:hypothetical protein